MSEQEDHPMLRLAWNNLTISSKYNKLVGYHMGRNDFTERDHKVLRVATMLALELCNETLQYCCVRLAKQLSLSETKETFNDVVHTLGYLYPNIASISSNVKKSRSEREKFAFKAKTIKEVADFLEKIEDLFETNATYDVDGRPLVIYHNVDFREHINKILESLDDNWEVLTSGFTRVDNLKRLDDTRKKIKHLMKRPVNAKLDHHNDIKDLSPSDTRTPRQIKDR